MRSFFGSLLLALFAVLSATRAEAQQGTWTEVPGTSLSAAVGATLAVPATGPWVGGAYNADTREFYLIRNGGHADGSKPISFKLDLDGGLWTQVEPDQPLTGRLDNNGNCPFPADNSAPANHTYDGVVWLGGTRYLHSGSPGGCTGATMSPGNFTFLVDTSTTPWTWTELPQFSQFAPGFMEVKDGIVYIVGGNSQMKWAKVDAATLQIISSGNVGSPVVINGVNQPVNTGFGSGASAAAIAGNLFCIINPGVAFAYCSNINGAQSGNNNDSFGRFLRRPLPGMAAFAYLGMAPAPDGQRLVLWHGDNRVWTWDPDDNTLNPTPADLWTAYTPAGGPIAEGQPGYNAKSARVYSKWFYAPHLNAFVGLADPVQQMWVYRLPDMDPPSTNEPPVAEDGAFVGAEDLPLAGAVTASDPEQAAVALSVVTPPQNGTFALNQDGSFVFTPDADWFGVTSFVYQASDGELTDTGTVTLTVTDVAEPPPPPPPPPANDTLTCTVDPFEHPAGAVPDNFNLTLRCQDSAQAEPAPEPDPDPSPPPPSAGYGLAPTATLAELCADPNTLLCDPLDNAPISGPAITEATTLRTMSEAIGSRYGSWRRAFSVDGPAFNPQIDPTAGEGGALKFTIPSQSAAGTAGQYTVDVSPDYSLGVVEGETLRIRLKVRWSCDVLFTDCDPQSQTYKQERRAYDVTDGFGGIKVFSVSEQDRGTGNNPIIDGGEGLGAPVWANRFQRGAMTGYVHINGSIDHLELPYPPNLQDIQPGGPEPCVRAGQTLVQPSACHMMRADEWVTIQMDFTYNGCSPTPSGAYDGRIKLWISDEGQPFDLVVDKEVWLGCSDIANPKIGKVWLTPYNTAKDPVEVHPEGYVWYDNLWVARLDG